MFFTDPNVRFPSHPKMIKDVFVYQVPYGAGILFQGGVKPLILIGHKSMDTVQFLLSKLNGENNIEEIIRELPETLQIDNLLYVLKKLHSYGLIQPKSVYEDDINTFSDEPLRRQLLFWGRKIGASGYISSSNEIFKIIQNRNLLIIGNGLLLVSIFDLLTRHSFQKISVIELIDSKESLISQFIDNKESIYTINCNTEEYENILINKVYDCVDDYHLCIIAIRRMTKNIFRRMNKISQEKNVCWLPIYENGITFEIGPIVTPNYSSCYTCLEMRRQSVPKTGIIDYVISNELSLEAIGEDIIGEDISANTFISGFISMEIIKFITNYALSSLINNYFEYNPIEGTFEKYSVLRVPHCPDCNKR